MSTKYTRHLLNCLPLVQPLVQPADLSGEGAASEGVHWEGVSTDLPPPAPRRACDPPPRPERPEGGALVAHPLLKFGAIDVVHQRVEVGQLADGRPRALVAPKQRQLLAVALPMISNAFSSYKNIEGQT